MYILRVVPLTTIPLPREQVLDYFSSVDLPAGALVDVPINRRIIPAVVLASALLADVKARVRTAVPYQLRSVARVRSVEPVITSRQRELGRWVAQHFWAPLGQALKAMLPVSVLRKPAKMLERVRQPMRLKSLPRLVWKVDRRDTYVSAVQRALSRGEQVLMLAPDAASEEFWSGVFADEKIPMARYSPTLLASRMRSLWADLSGGAAVAVVGARSAVFLPFSNLGLVIVEDEESDAHKSWVQSPRYDVREVAEKLAELHGADLIFGSAAPTLARQLRARRGTLGLDGPDRGAGKALSVEVVDLRPERAAGNESPLSRRLQETMDAALAEGRPAILFVNRRGTAPVLICRDCGAAVECPRCSASLVQHRGAIRGKGSGNVLVCHHCNHRASVPDVCPSCRGHDLRAFGAGTERIETEARRLWPNASVARLDSDVAPRPADVAAVVDRFCAGATNILVGTQLLSALRYRVFPKPLLFGIVAVDPLLAFPDYRVTERLWQLIRSLGRSAAEAIAQTHRPDHPFLPALAGPPAAFYDAELADRRSLGFPPFSEFIKLTFRHRDESKAQSESAALARQLAAIIAKSKVEDRVRLLGPAPAFIVRERGRFIWNLVIQSRLTSLRARNQLLAFVPSDWIVDVHPESIL